MAQQLETRVASPAFPDPYAPGGFAPPRSLPTPVPPHAHSFAPPPHNFSPAQQFLSPAYNPGGFSVPQPYGGSPQPFNGQQTGSSPPRAPATPALPTASQFAAPPAPAPSQFAPSAPQPAGGTPVLEMPRATVQSLTDKMPGLNADVDTKVRGACSSPSR